MAKTEIIPEIQALRAVAALMVVCRHAWSGFYPGAAGVDLFFVISGFTMVYSSQRMFGSSKSTLTFLYRRIVRIYPTYWIASVLLVFVVGMPETGHLVKSMVLIPEAEQPFLAPGWTLIHEMSFYLIFSCCLFLPMRRAIWLTISALVVLVFSRHWTHIEPLQVLSRPLVLEFGAGCLIGLIKCEGSKIKRPAAMLFALGALVIFVAYPRYDLIAGEDWLRLLLWGLPAAIIVGTVTLGPANIALRWYPFQLLGDASYSIYLIHWIVAAILGGAWNAYPLLMLGGSICAGVVFYRWVEQPLLQVMRGRRQTLKSSVAAT